MSERIGLFGGTFDPPHLAHLIMAEEAKNALNLDEVWFIPVHTPPHKQRENMISGEERLMLVEAAIEDNAGFRTSSVEIERGGPSYTIDTVRYFKQQAPETEFFFLIGGDMADQMDKWKDIEKLRRLVEFVFVNRPGYNGHKPSWLTQVEAPTMHVSSSMIRRRLRDGETVRYIVPENVLKEIEGKKLYGQK